MSWLHSLLLTVGVNRVLNAKAPRSAVHASIPRTSCQTTEWGDAARPRRRVRTSLPAQSAVCSTSLTLRRGVRGAQARLKPFTWAARYAPAHGPIAEFLRKHVSTFYFRDDGAVFVPDPPARPSRASSHGAHLHPAGFETGFQGRDTVCGPSGRPLRTCRQGAHLRPQCSFCRVWS